MIGHMTDFPEGTSNPARRALAAAGYDSLESVADVPDKKLLALHGVGPKAIRLIRAALAD